VSDCITELHDWLITYHRPCKMEITLVKVWVMSEDGYLGILMIGHYLK